MNKKNNQIALLKKLISSGIVSITGDYHCNDTVGLCPPHFVTDHGLTIEHNKAQAFIWQNWLAYWEEMARLKRELRLPLVAVLDGELADMNIHTRTGLISHSPVDAKRLALAALQPALDAADIVFVCRGTPAHAGEDAHIDEELAQEIGAVRYGPDSPYAHWVLLMEVGGVLFDVAHHPGVNHGTPWTRGNDANKLAFATRAAYIEAGLRPPDVVARGHIHKYADSGHNHRTRAVINWSWKATDAYAQKFGGRPFPLPIGGSAFVCRDGRYEYLDYRYEWPVERIKAWTPELMIPYDQR